MKIGDFARLGQVSVRMLRHYDEIGLLRPESVDPWTGHRRYRTAQLARLNRIVALKDLGLTLEQVSQVLADEVSTEQLRGMLRLRQAELNAEMNRGRTRLAGIAYRLRLIESEEQMSEASSGCVVKTAPAMRLAVRTATAGSQPEIAEMMGPLFGAVAAAVTRTGACTETGVAIYGAGEDTLSITAGYLYDGAPATGFEILELPETEVAALVHLGDMEDIASAWQTLHAWIEANDYVPTGPPRAVYLEAPGEDPAPDWVTELQQPVRRQRVGDM